METDAFLQIERKSAIPEVLSRLRKSIYENGAIISSFNKDVLFDGFCNIRDIPLILVARGSSIRFERRVYSITKSRQPWSIALGVIIFGLAAPISISAGFILALRGISNALIHNIRSEGYGIPRK